MKQYLEILGILRSEDLNGFYTQNTRRFEPSVTVGIEPKTFRILIADFNKTMTETSLFHQLFV
jgi:hypothetical protein